MNRKNETIPPDRRSPGRRVIALGFYVVFAVLSSCGKEKAPPQRGAESQEQSVEPSAELSAASHDPAVKASGKVMAAQLFVENSVPAGPGTTVDILNDSASPPEVIVSGATIREARWKVPGPFQLPKYPASGFLTFMLTEGQMRAIEGKDISIRPTEEGPPDKPDAGDSE